MPEFEELQHRLREQELAERRLRLRVSADRNQLQRLDERGKAVRRTEGADGGAAGAAVERARVVLEQTVVDSRAELAALALERERAGREWERLSDPRTNVERLNDDLPVLLFPLRLETRFKRFTDPNGGLNHQLLVRVFPDACLVDTFEELPSEAEYLRSRAYWIARYRAGEAGADASAAVRQTVREAQLAAWRNLVDTGAPGRAYWLTENLTPLPGQVPAERASVDDVLLVVAATADRPIAAERAALTAFYRSAWQASGNATLLQNAQTDLVTAVGETRAAELPEQYPPAGLAEGEARSAAAGQRVEVTFLEFPTEDAVDRTISAWSEPVRTALLPDRLVVQGFRDGKPVLDELGPLIPQPLVIGPDPGEDIEEVLREAFPDDFDEMTDDAKAAAYVEYLRERADTRWLFDFEAALEKGMGFRIDLDAEDYRLGFDRLFVMGIRLAGDAERSREDLQKLLYHHQYGAAGLAFLPQGLATNRSEDEESPYTQFEGVEESFDRLIAASDPASGSGNSRGERSDGRWFSELLGIDPGEAGLQTAAYFNHTDQCESLAAQRALYPATLGFFLDSMLATGGDDRPPLVGEWAKNVTEEFYHNHVTGRGRLPALRIGDQPYGVLPVGRHRRARWLDGDFNDNDDIFRIGGMSDHAPTLRELLNLLNEVRRDWSENLPRVAHLHREGDAHQALLDVLGLHATSVEFDQRMGETVEQLFNRLRASGLGATILAAFFTGAYLERTKALFTRHGHDLDELLGDNADGNDWPPIMKLLFFRGKNRIKGNLIDDRPLSEFEPIRPYTGDGNNYIEWLVDKLKNDPRAVQRQSGFTAGDRPQAVLYELLRHATDLKATDLGLDLYRQNKLLTGRERDQLRAAPSFVGVRQEIGNAVESRYELLNRVESRIGPAGNPVAVIDHLSDLLQQPTGAPRGWKEHLAALEKLSDLPTARLERLLAEHLDTANYRLDAWLQGFTNLQLYGMRYGEEFTSSGDDNFSDTDLSFTDDAVSSHRPGLRSGSYLGAYGWVENLRPQNRRLSPAELSDRQRQVFDPAGDQNPVTDTGNAGYVHAPSLDHAATAAVLRNAYLSRANPDNPDYYSINLSSERVRMALQIIEGMQSGQELGALLGYQLERGLHDRTSENLDEFIYVLRTRFLATHQPIKRDPTNGR